MTNLKQRILTAAIAIPVIVIICLAGGIYFFIFISVASAFALFEFYRLASLKGAKPNVIFGILSGFFINLSFYHPSLRNFIVGFFDKQGMSLPFPSQAQLFLTTVLIIIAVSCMIELFRNNGSAILNLSTTVFGMLYISFFFGTFIGLRELFTVQDFPVLRFFPNAVNLADPDIGGQIFTWGGYTVISVLASIWICDTAAFHAGSVIGKHKLFPRVSPNKSWEGAIFGFVFAVLTAIAAKYILLEYLSLGNAIIIGMIVGIFGQLGDLAESLLKRDAGVKDSSALIPGHGGVFDRFDSLLLVSPLVYFYLDFVVFS